MALRADHKEMGESRPPVAVLEVLLGSLPRIQAMILRQSALLILWLFIDALCQAPGISFHDAATYGNLH